MSLQLVEGWSGPIDYRLQSNGVNMDFTGLTATNFALDLLDRNNNPSTSTGTLSITCSTGGVLRFTPGSTGDFISSLSPYALRYSLSTGGGVTYFPSADPEIVTVKL